MLETIEKSEEMPISKLCVALASSYMNGDLEAFENSLKQVVSKLGVSKEAIIINGIPLANLAALNGEIQVLDLLDQYKFNLETEFNYNGVKPLTPIYCAMHAGHYAAAKFLQGVGCKVDPEQPIFRKITPQKFYELLGNCEEKEVVIKDLLESNGYAADLSFMALGASNEKFNHIDFSNVSLANSVVSGNNIAMRFKNANLENVVFGRFKTQKIDLKDALHTETISATTKQNIEIEYCEKYNLNIDNFFIIKKEHRFDQDAFNASLNLRKANVEDPTIGECLGFSMEYCRSLYRWLQKGHEDDFNAKFIEKLNSKTINLTGHMVDRIQFFQSSFNGNNNFTYTINPEELNDIINKLNKHKFAVLCFNSNKNPNIGHAIGVYVEHDALGNPNKYNIFDSNLGISEVTNESGVLKSLNILNKIYSCLYQDQISWNIPFDCEQILLENNIISADIESYDKSSKNLHKFWEALQYEDNDQVAELAKSINFIAKYGSAVIDGQIPLILYPLLFNSIETIKAFVGNNSLKGLVNNLKGVEEIVALIIEAREGDKIEILEILKARLIELCGTNSIDCNGKGAILECMESLNNALECIKLSESKAEENIDDTKEQSIELIAPAEGSVIEIV
ncbi:MAG: hypothetical protein K0R73_1176 [Candidatus Midichloriaceae bacterium]|jgi:hypothetical protein|nr:hypothetical protein [Candidatus Midichloriaceae bacterium]